MHCVLARSGYDEDSMSPECKDLIDKLLSMDFNKRLGAKGAQEIKGHPWFKSTSLPFARPTLLTSYVCPPRFADIKWDKIRTSRAPIEIENLEDLTSVNQSSLSKKKEQIQREIFQKLKQKSGHIQRNSMIQGMNTLFRADLLAKINKINAEESIKLKEKESEEKKEKICHLREIARDFDKKCDYLKNQELVAFFVDPKLQAAPLPSRKY